MSSIISAFLALVLSLALAIGSEKGEPMASLKIEENTQSESNADSHLEGNKGLEIAADAHLGASLGSDIEASPTPNPSPIPSPIPTGQPEASEGEESNEDSLSLGIGAEVSDVAKSDTEAPVDESEQDNAGETHGQAVSAQAITNASANIQIGIPANVSLKLGL